MRLLFLVHADGIHIIERTHCAVYAYLVKEIPKQHVIDYYLCTSRVWPAKNFFLFLFCQKETRRTCPVLCPEILRTLYTNSLAHNSTWFTVDQICRLQDWVTRDWCTVGWGTMAQCFCLPYLKTWFFCVVFNAELNGAIRILCFCRAIIDLLWTSRAQLGHSRSIMAWRKHKMLMVPLKPALKTT